MSHSQYGTGISWCREHGPLLDEQLQCVAVVVPAPLVRAAIQLLTAFLRPPQPVHVGKDFASAFAFAASEECSTVRSFREASLARDAKYGKPKW